MNRNIDSFLEGFQGKSFTMDQLSEYGADLMQVVQSYKIVIIVSLIAGLLLCFLGLKLVKLWSGINGLVVGAVLGLTVSLLIGLSGITILLVVLCAGLLMLVLSVIFRRLGMFWVCLFAGSSIGVIVMFTNPIAGLIAMLAVGLLAAIIGAIIRDPVVIIMTSIHGGLASGMALTLLVANSSYLIGVIFGIVLTILGMVVQFMLKSREIGKKETIQAQTVKEEQSRESEVEAARNIIMDDEEE